MFKRTSKDSTPIAEDASSQHSQEVSRPISSGASGGNNGRFGPSSSPFSRQKPSSGADNPAMPEKSPGVPEDLDVPGYFNTRPTEPPPSYASAQKPTLGSRIAGLTKSHEDMSNAVLNKDTKKVKTCLVSGKLSPNYCIPGVVPEAWTTMIDVATYKGDEPMVLLLLAYDADITGVHAKLKAEESTYRKWATTLHYAVNRGHDSIVKILIERGKADVDAWDHGGVSPLQMAAYSGMISAASLLIHAGALIDAVGIKGSALHVAAAWNRRDMIRFLLRQGASINVQNDKGRTPLIEAVLERHDETFKFLILNGANLEAKDQNSFTAFFAAAGNSDKSTMKLLLKHGADIEARDGNGCTALIRAVMARNEALVNLLLRLGIDIDAQDSDGWTALYASIVNGDDDLAQDLLENGANMQGIDSDGNTLLHQAAKTGSTFVTRFLLAKGMNLETQNDKQEKPLHFASNYGHRAIVHLLLTKAANVSPKDSRGRTPLHLAANNDHYAVVQELALNGAIIDAKDNDARTPIEGALRHSHNRIVLFLESQGALQPSLRKSDMTESGIEKRSDAELPEYNSIATVLTDISRLRQKQGKSRSDKSPTAVAKGKAKDTGKDIDKYVGVDPFEVSVWRGEPSGRYIRTVDRRMDDLDVLKLGRQAANLVPNIIGAFAGGD